MLGIRLQELYMTGVRLDNRKILARQLEPFKLKRVYLDVDDYAPEIIVEVRKKVELIDRKKNQKDPIPALRATAESPGSIAP